MRYLFSFLLFFLVTKIDAQNLFVSVQDGDWDNASTWFSGGGAGGIEGVSYPGSSDSVYVNHDVLITATNSGSDFLFEGYLNISSGNELRCTVGSSTNGFLLDNDGVIHVYGSFYTAVVGEEPATASPTAKEFTCQGNSKYISHSGSSLFVSDDWEINENAFVFIEENVCLRVDDDVNFNGTGWFMCGDGDISIGGDGAGSNVSYGGGATTAQLCTGTSILRNTVSTDCSSGTTITTGTGPTGAAPTAVNDTIITDANSITNIDVLNIGVDDSDPADDTLQILQIGSNGAINDGLSAQGGSIAINDNGTPNNLNDDYVVYDPPTGYTGADSFQYIIEDEQGLKDTALVIINIIDCGNSYVELIGVGANGSTTATLNFSDVATIDSIRVDLIYKNGKPTFATFTTATQTLSGTSIDAINIAGADDGVYRTTINAANSVTVTHDNSGGVRSLIAYIYRSGTISSITSIPDDRVVYLYQDVYSFTQAIQAGSGTRTIKVQMPISELNVDSRSALLEVQAGPIYGSLETFTADLGNSLKIFTLILEDVPGNVTELEVTITSKTGGAGDSFITGGIDFGIQCSGVGPDAVDDFVSTEENTAVTINILSNDILGNAGFDTTSLTNLGLLDPQNGTVTFNASGQAIYTPDGGFTGVDYFQYMVCDTSQLCAIAKVTIVVTCAGGQFAEIAGDIGLDLGGNKDGGLSWADFNYDGLLDVIVNTNNATNDTRIYFAEKNGGVITFTDVTTTNASGLLDNTNERSVVTGDMNNDGYVDFVRNTYQNTGIEIWWNRGPGSTPPFSFGNGSQDENLSINTFSTSNQTGDGFNTEGIALADWNQDGWLDIIVENDGDGIEILQNEKDGTYSEVAHATSGFAIGTGGSNKGDYSTTIDYNNDGYIDFMARRTGDADLYEFDPATSKFVAVAGLDLSSAGEKGAITFCDVDQDGDFDFIWAHNESDNATVVYLQAADGSFSLGATLSTDSGIEECDCADVDNDGDNDIFLGDDNGTSYLYINATPKGGALSFSQDNRCINPSADVEGSEFVDYDQDGDPDLYMNINGADNQMWVNGQDDKNYLLVEPRIRLANGRYRSATGANVMLIENCTDTCLIKDVSGGRGHGSQKPPILHFGLPNGPDKYYKIIVFYPDSGGQIDTVIRTITPSKLTGQKLIIYQTDSDFDICVDADNDGILNINDIDDDNDGIKDVDESFGLNNAVGDEDGDGIENWQDIVDNGNGGDGSATIYTDTDGNGIPDIHDPDGDGVPNHYDKDADGDGIPDIIEAGGVDTDGNGVVDGVFNDGGNSDGWSNVFDDQDGSGGTPLVDNDTDGDGFENRIDLDADNDGIADIIEAGGIDYDGNGRVDGKDEDGDGLDDLVDVDQGGSVLSLPDTDGDGSKNYVDYDSDNDGINDNIEGQTTAGFRAMDNDFTNDGWDTEYNGNVSNGVQIVISNKDDDALADYWDLDSDADGFPDYIEGFDDDNSGDALNDLIGRAATFEAASSNLGYYVNSTDGDSDNVPDWLEDDDTDGTPNFLDHNSTFFKDSDSDGIVDLYDTDNFGVDSNTPDIDSDGEYDFRDVSELISLPIELMKFEAIKRNQTALLVWKTSSEINNDYFIIERSINGTEFIEVARINGAGNSNEELEYQVIDNTPNLGVNYYRLKQVDFDGASSLSQIEAIEFFGDKFGVGIYPNPSSVIDQEISLDIQNINTEASVLIRLMNYSGVVILNQEIHNPDNSIVYKLSNSTQNKLSAGVYFVSIQNGNKQILKKIVVHK